MTTYATNAASTPKSTRIETIKARIHTASKTIEFRLMTIVLTALMLWGAAIATFGYPALIIVALTLVPLMFVALMLITVGK